MPLTNFSSLNVSVSSGPPLKQRSSPGPPLNKAQKQRSPGPPLNKERIRQRNASEVEALAQAQGWDTMGQAEWLEHMLSMAAVPPPKPEQQSQKRQTFTVYNDEDGREPVAAEAAQQAASIARLEAAASPPPGSAPALSPGPEQSHALSSLNPKFYRLMVDGMEVMKTHISSNRTVKRVLFVDIRLTHLVCSKTKKTPRTKRFELKRISRVAKIGDNSFSVFVNLAAQDEGKENEGAENIGKKGKGKKRRGFNKAVLTLTLPGTSKTRDILVEELQALVEYVKARAEETEVIMNTI